MKIMKRKIYQKLLEWKNSKDRKPLMLLGARQVGKSYIVEEFCKKEFSNYVIVNALNPAITTATQWFERTLDDSANKRISVPESFLAIDGILDLCINVASGLVVYPKVIEKRLRAELPFMATENIMMDAVKEGGDRQQLHEIIRQLSMEAGRNVKEKGLDNNLLELIEQSEDFNLTKEQLQECLDASKYIGCASMQVKEYLDNIINPILEVNRDEIGVEVNISV